ncbi:aromatic-ring-hydroxylating dioxygenase subunit beta [Sulfuracidifex metallicus]|uniref:Aromatic-ring-hydroxylating dioxygenase subunit beta n=1 Tax=Sulfuracidifex metallicus DSM 6482 = JCM 9184 TaxID=523847 RepID=A0A6A9QP25_SULME|nr:aromatic-ring-hydroxylating dioxygenase subunit beta [Sulfuracidifex metallicus]MUN29035.1 hypothetical protein [Sulfuracidifex metallicus DSM 6482 = JCM 9184]WOE50454.1 aromatic-ring-hydroxylating dioxygenase subunit beta [Sulfuracidifex metallicus DSM 6482 = JCM 9184]
MIISDGLTEEEKEALIKFLYKEISLLEEGKCEEWISMLTDDVRYYMPVSLVTRNGDVDGSEISILDENKESLTIKCRKMRTSYNWIETPPSRIRFHPSKIFLMKENEEFKVEISMLLFMDRLKNSQIISLVRKDIISIVNGEFKIKSRVLELDCEVPNVVFSRII